MSAPLALAEPIAPSTAQHWLRLALPAEWRGSVEAEGRLRFAWRDRLSAIGKDLRQFLMAYSAGLITTAVFIA